MPSTNGVFLLVSSVIFCAGCTLTGCGPMRSLPPVAVSRAAVSMLPQLPAIDAATLDGYQIDHVMLLYFKDGMSPQRWTEVFRGAAQLAKKQKEQKIAFAERLREDPEAEPDMEGVAAILGLIDDNLLSAVGNFSIWSSTQALCLISKVSQQAQVICENNRSPEKIEPAPEPSLGAFTARPADLKRKIFLPYFESHGAYSGPKGNFKFELQLRPEPIHPELPDQLVLKGDLLFEPGYTVMDMSTHPTKVFPFGYAEILLRRATSDTLAE